jgi:SPP1 family predicted phage head-tail adaptor
VADFIPDDELASIRGVAYEALPDRVYVQTATLVSDGGGDYTRTWANARRVHARIARASSNESEAIMRDAVIDAPVWVVSLPYDETITTHDRILTDDGRIFEVVSVDRARSYQLHVRALCVEAR